VATNPNIDAAEKARIILLETEKLAREMRVTHKRTDISRTAVLSAVFELPEIRSKIDENTMNYLRSPKKIQLGRSMGQSRSTAERKEKRIHGSIPKSRARRGKR
ncbi:MAG: hypothetical protein NUV67_01170, partial [archaeon]|nr:hypothetical protein [archaeon]